MEYDQTKNDADGTIKTKIASRSVEFGDYNAASLSVIFLCLTKVPLRLKSGGI